jgi:hypothetical protein
MIKWFHLGFKGKTSKVVIDYSRNSGIGGVDLSDAYLTSYRSTRKRLKNAIRSTSVIGLISLVWIHIYFIKKRRQHFQNGISSVTYRKFNFKIPCNRREIIRLTTRNCPIDKDDCSSLSLIHCCQCQSKICVSTVLYTTKRVKIINVQLQKL